MNFKSHFLLFFEKAKEVVFGTAFLKKKLFLVSLFFKKGVFLVWLFLKKPPLSSSSGLFQM